MLAGMIQAPEAYSPYNNFKAAKERQEVVLARMKDLGWITPEQEAEAQKAKLKIGKPTAWQGSKAPYVTDTVIQELQDKFGKDVLVKGGLRVQTTVDFEMQKQAEQVVHNAYRR
ncbi:MAG: penicillin-binding protein, partial [Microcystaceae cyanobacterium]